MSDLKPLPNCDLNHWDKELFDNLRYDDFPSRYANHIIQLRAEVLTLRRRLAEIVEYTSTVYDEPPSVDQLIYDTACIHLIATGEMDKLTEGKDDTVDQG
jgi:hypothetical protein